MDTLLECGGLMASAAEDVERAKTRRRVRHPEWFRDYARLEQEAVELQDYSSLVLPGLLQTEAHANVVFRTRQPFLADRHRPAPLDGGSRKHGIRVK
ncbi:Scr1 family TA system antitoxin-like transcriptional regulator [Streptomyces mayonensis]|uniref:Scr1 family TA system antitoxin-like transcriptional regulator n=1 Tax=Streptomyces mayonensis TaxID=2750816 RepID=UPI0020A691D7|nr:Scr1 family TA system antitoxin-like transcriptional regulator [Streptomyces sp. A108]